MPSIRDASLTTLKRQQRALAAYRNSYNNFPVGNTSRPEQVRYKTGDVPINARLGMALSGCGCNSSNSNDPDGYGKRAPASSNNQNF